MALHPNLKSLCVENVRDAAEWRLAVRQKLSIPASKETDFAETHDQSFGSHVHFNLVPLDLVSQGFLQLSFQSIDIQAFSTRSDLISDLRPSQLIGAQDHLHLSGRGCFHTQNGSLRTAGEHT